jgi:tryptophan synthase alpha chain
MFPNISQMNRISELFATKNKNILNIYFTAGFPKLESTTHILEILQNFGVDLVEIGMPFSDPLADGETIQQSNEVALNNGMNLKVLFQQLQNIRSKIHIPIILMGYLNPILQFGMENFCQQCSQVGVDGIILPDLPLQVYETEYKSIFEKYNLKNTFLITPQTSENRIKKIDELSNGFIYMVSSASTTGAKSAVSNSQEAYFQKVQEMNLQNPRLIGFGISDNATFSKACQYANGAIIGSAFIKKIEKSQDLPTDISDFVKMVRG